MAFQFDSMSDNFSHLLDLIVKMLKSIEENEDSQGESQEPRAKKNSVYVINTPSQE